MTSIFLPFILAKSTTRKMLPYSWSPTLSPSKEAELYIFSHTDSSPRSSPTSSFSLLSPSLPCHYPSALIFPLCLAQWMLFPRQLLHSCLRNIKLPKYMGRNFRIFPLIISEALPRVHLILINNYAIMVLGIIQQI